MIYDNYVFIETRLSVAKEVLVLECFQNLQQAGGRKILTIVIKLIQEAHKHDKRHYKAPV